MFHLNYKIRLKRLRELWTIGVLGTYSSLERHVLLKLFFCHSYFTSFLFGVLKFLIILLSNQTNYSSNLYGMEAMIGLKENVFAMTSPYVVSVWLILLFLLLPQTCLGWNLFVITNLKVYGRQLSCLLSTHYGDMLWISYAPESVLNNLFSSQLFDLIRAWYVFRKKAAENLHDC